MDPYKVPPKQVVSKKAINYAIIQHTYKKKNENEILRVHYGRWHAHDLTSEQVLGRATSNFVWKRLVRVKKSLWILGFSATSIKIRHRLFKSWIAPTNCVIQWIVIYPMDSAIHLLNNWGLAEGSVPSQQTSQETLREVYLNGLKRS